MFAHGPSKFWKRHPYLNFLFTAVCSTAAIVGGILAVRDGSFRVGHSANASVITRAGSPVYFYTFLVVDFGIAAILLLVGITEVVLHRRRKAMRESPLPNAKLFELAPRNRPPQH